MNECLVNFIDKNLTAPAGQKFAMEVLDFMRERLVGYQEETGNLYNLEATPAEGTAYRLAKMDKARFPDITTAGEKEPYYTNSSHLPVGFSDDVFDALKLQDDLQTKYTGGTVLHGFIGERITDHEMVKVLLKKIFTKYHLPYFTFTPTFSICPNHGYISGEHFICPHCLIPQQCEVYSRVVGYIRPVQQWHVGKQEEYNDRKEYAVRGIAKTDAN
jgi:ribonucleoside-triphosphate reductase